MNEGGTDLFVLAEDFSVLTMTTTGTHDLMLDSSMHRIGTCMPFLL